jgi:hypothetical protein
MRPMAQDSATPDAPFPEYRPSYAPEDQHRLRHWPDIVRPGGAVPNAGAVSPLGR